MYRTLLLDGLIQLLAVFLSSPFLTAWFYPMIALAFLATVPFIFRSFFFWR